RDEIIRRLSTLPNNEVMNFYCRDREKLLNILARWELTDANSLIGVSNCVDGEKAVINLIKYVPDNQIDSLCKLLSGDFYKQLCSQIDDFWGDDNFTELNNIVNSIKRKSSHTAQIISQIREYAETNNFLYNDKKLMECIRNFPKSDLQMLFDCMFGEDGVYVKLNDYKATTNNFSEILSKHLNSYYQNDFINIPLTERIKYLSYFGHYRLGMNSKFDTYHASSFVNLFFNTTPDKDLLKVIEVLDKDNRKIYDNLKWFGGKDFMNNVYSKIKQYYKNQIPLSKRKEYFLYYSNLDEVYEPEEFIVIDLIETTPKNDVKRLFDYMSENDLFRPLASKIDNANGFSGGDNYDKFYILCFNKWRELYPEVNEVLFHKYTKFAFKDWLTRKIGERNITHIEISASTQVGVGVFNGIASTALGYATDAYGNVALYGNFVASASVVPVGNVRWNSISEFFQKDISQQIDMFPDCNIIAGNGAGVTLSVNFDYAAKNLTDLFGKGSSISESFNFRGLGLSFIQNFDGDNNFIGVGLGLDLTASGAVKFTKATVENKGIIVSKKEFEYLKKMSLENADFNKPTFEYKKVSKITDGRQISKNILYIFGIDTNIEVNESSKDYCIISKCTGYDD
ncbi:MAG: hypothetical protein IKQ46_00950, partial [Bacteroidales bacterium]|nr:hypothetical protein [Bacteroidales bacterium]